MNILDIALWGALVPALLTFFAVVLARSPAPSLSRPESSTLEPGTKGPQTAPTRVPVRSLLIPLAVAVALTIAFVSIMGPLKPWPIESVRRVPHALALAVLLAAIALRLRPSLPILIAALLATGASAWSILEVLAANGRTNHQSLWTSIAILAALASIAPALITGPARASTIPRLTLSLSFLVPFLALSIALMVAARTESGARLAGAAVAIASALAASSILPKPFARSVSTSAPAIAIVLSTLLVALLAWGRWFAGVFTATAWHPGLPWSSLVLFALAPALAAALIPTDRPPTRRRSALILAAPALASIVALALALSNRPSTPHAGNPYADLVNDP